MNLFQWVRGGVAIGLYFLLHMAAAHFTHSEVGTLAAVLGAALLFFGWMLTRRYLGYRVRRVVLELSSDLAVFAAVVHTTFCFRVYGLDGGTLSVIAVTLAVLYAFHLAHLPRGYWPAWLKA